MQSKRSFPCWAFAKTKRVLFFPDQHLGRNTARTMGVGLDEMCVWNPHDPRLGGKVVLTILDALRPQYAGGPFPGAQFKTNYGAIFASRDAVAIDATGLRLLDDFRKDAGLPLLAKKTRWPATAELLGLGTADETHIELIRTGLESEVRWSEP